MYPRNSGILEFWLNVRFGLSLNALIEKPRQDSQRGDTTRTDKIKGESDGKVAEGSLDAVVVTGELGLTGSKESAFSNFAFLGIIRFSPGFPQ